MLCLAITRFEAAPERVTELLQIIPTSIGRAGEASPSGRLRPFSDWWLEAHEARLIDGSQHHAALNILRAVVSSGSLGYGK
jgi:hypothetical protein